MQPSTRLQRTAAVSAAARASGKERGRIRASAACWHAAAGTAACWGGGHIFTPAIWHSLTLAGLLLGETLPCARAENWPQWRGPFFNGSTSATNLPSRLNNQEHVVWIRPLPGRSGATPVVWEDSIFLPSPDDQKNLLLLCLERSTGRVRWQKQVGTGDRVAGKNNMASCSAATVHLSNDDIGFRVVLETKE